MIDDCFDSSISLANCVIDGQKASDGNASRLSIVLSLRGVDWYAVAYAQSSSAGDSLMISASSIGSNSEGGAPPAASWSILSSSALII